MTSSLTRRYQHKPRALEWFAHWCSIAWGVTMAMPGDTITGLSGMAPLLRQGWTEEALAAVLTTMGALGWMALWANGSWATGSPRFRCVMAGLSALVWGQIDGAFWIDWWSRGVLSTGAFVYLGLTVSFGYAVMRSRREQQ